MKKIIISAILFLSAGFVSADTITPNCGLTEPDIGSTGWGLKLNANFGIIDGCFMPIASTHTLIWVNTSSLTITGLSPGVMHIVATSSKAVTGLVLSTEIANSGVVAASYGDATHIATFTVNAAGQITQAGVISVSGGGGGNSTLAVGTGTASNFTTSVTSPTAAISFLGSQFKSTSVGTTNFISLTASVGSPGGSTTNIQFNNAGSFAGSNALQWDNANSTLTVNGKFGSYDSGGNSFIFEPNGTSPYVRINNSAGSPGESMKFSSFGSDQSSLDDATTVFEIQVTTGGTSPQARMDFSKNSQKISFTGLSGNFIEFNPVGNSTFSIPVVISSLTVTGKQNITGSYLFVSGTTTASALSINNTDSGGDSTMVFTLPNSNSHQSKAAMIDAEFESNTEGSETGRLDFPIRNGSQWFYPITLYSNRISLGAYLDQNEIDLGKNVVGDMKITFNGNVNVGTITYHNSANNFEMNPIVTASETVTGNFGVYGNISGSSETLTGRILMPPKVSGTPSIIVNGNAGTGIGFTPQNTIEIGVNGPTVATFSAVGFNVLSETVSNTLNGAGLNTCGDSTHGLGWSAGTFNCQSITGSGSTTIYNATSTAGFPFGFSVSTETVTNSIAVTTTTILDEGIYVGPGSQSHPMIKFVDTNSTGRGATAPLAGIYRDPSNGISLVDAGTVVMYGNSAAVSLRENTTVVGTLSATGQGSVGTNSVSQRLGGAIFTMTASSSCSNSTANTNIVGVGTGTVTLPANFWQVGNSLKVKASGFYSSTTSAGNFSFNLKIGTFTIVSTTTFSLVDSQSNEWMFATNITCRSVGGTGTVFSQGALMVYDTSNFARILPLFNTTTTTIDTTLAGAVSLNVQFSKADPVNSITNTNMIVSSE